MSARQMRIAETETQRASLRGLNRDPRRRQEQMGTQAATPPAALWPFQFSPHGPAPADLLARQRVTGNRSVRRMLTPYFAASSQNSLLQRDGSTTPPTPATLATTPAGSLRVLEPADLNRFRRLLAARDQAATVRFIAQIMERRGEIDAALLTTQAVSGHAQADCRNADAYVIDPAVNGANTISCGCLTDAGGRRLPNPRIRLNFDLLQSRALTTPHQNEFHEHLAEILHSTLLHEFRHVVQDYAACNTAGGQARGICTDCNSPLEVDAYLAEIEAGYRPGVYRHAWVRVFVNWDYLAPEQQAVFSTRQAAARRKIDTAFPGIDWAADREVAQYRAWCRSLETAARGPSRGACDDPMAPLNGGPATTGR
ncbi:MAG: hypothetical protein ACM30E_04575 [Nitrososphaerales archaeon]